jgi:hypothetical protein
VKNQFAPKQNDLISNRVERAATVAGDFPGKNCSAMKKWD